MRVRSFVALFILGVGVISTHVTTPLTHQSSELPFWLPIASGTTIYVTQGNNSSFTHKGKEAYAFDFAVAGINVGFTVTAAQSGKVIAVEDSSNIQCDGLNHEVSPEVQYLRNCWSYANFIIIADDDGTTAAEYLHLAPGTVKVQTGQHVNQGDPLATAGHTGWATFTHLHFQVNSISNYNGSQNIYWADFQSLQISFANPEVLAKDANGIPVKNDHFLVSAPASGTQSPPVFTPAKNTPLTAAKNIDGRMEIFAIGQDLQLYHNAQLPDSSWSGWYALGGNWANMKAPAIGVNSDGRLEAFMVGNSTNVYHAWQNSPGSMDWSSWVPISLPGTFPPQTPGVVLNEGNGLEVFLVGWNGQLYHSWQNNGWDNWYDLGGNFPIQSPAVTRNHDGRMDVFLIGFDTHVYHTYENSDGSWTGFTSISAPGTFPPQTLSATTNMVDGVEIFLRGWDGRVYHAWENIPSDDSSWSAWYSLGGNAPGSNVTAIDNADGRMEVFSVGSDTFVYHCDQQPNTGWVTCGSVSAPGTFPNESVAVTVNMVGGLEVFLLGWDNHIYHAWESPPGNYNWTVWYQFS